MTDIIHRIDEALRCRCGKELPARHVSDDFCSDDCQRQWHAARTDPIPEQFAGFTLPQSAFERPARKELPVWHREPVAADPEQMLPPPEAHRSLVYDALVAVGFHALVAATALSNHVERVAAWLRDTRRGG